MIKPFYRYVNAFSSLGVDLSNCPPRVYSYYVKQVFYNCANPRKSAEISSDYTNPNTPNYEDYIYITTYMVEVFAC